MPSFSLEGELHHESMLPHLYSSADIKRMFPEIEDMGEIRLAEITGNEGMGAAEPTTGRRKVVRRNIGIGGKRIEKASENCRSEQ